MGYAGGTTKDPTYHELGDHTEAIEIDFDPALVSYEELLRVFWKSHRPTRACWSRQYRSAIFVHDDEQRRLARATRDAEAQRTGSRIHTEIEAYREFYRAEDYHQKYRLRNTPRLMAQFAAVYPDAKDFTDSTAAARVNGYLAGEGDVKDLDDVLARLKQ